MKEAICRLCGQKFESELNGKCLWHLGNHIRKIHSISVEEYLLNGKEYPLCKCGCGNKVKFFKWKFGKYFEDHKNNVQLSDEHKKAISSGLLKIHGKTEGYKKLLKDDLAKWWELYKTSDSNQNKIKQISGIDFRTLKKYWIDEGVTSIAEINRYVRLHKSVWSNQGEKNGQYQKIEDDELTKIYQFLNENKNKYTLKKLRSELNIKVSSYALIKRLYEKFDKNEIKSLLKCGMASKPESEFYYVLLYYFGEKNVKKGFKIKGSRKIYDFCLFDKLIIEWDGEYWHSSDSAKINDKIKEELAIKNGYMLFRVKEKESKQIELLLKIKELTDEIQTNSSVVS